MFEVPEFRAAVGFSVMACAVVTLVTGEWLQWFCLFAAIASCSWLLAKLS